MATFLQCGAQRYPEKCNRTNIGETWFLIRREYGERFSDVRFVNIFYRRENTHHTANQGYFCQYPDRKL